MSESSAWVGSPICDWGHSPTSFMRLLGGLEGLTLEHTVQPLA